MKSAFDWITVLMFAGLVTHFLQQSADRGSRAAPLWQYGLAASGCALGDWLGNQGQALAAAAVIALTAGFIAYFLFYRGGERPGH